ncbi:MAG TPA: cytochrome c-type biogenesis protein [Steroidobacteraceae bacterium]|nr:cytochrome c-type biogenesis protein [Steroidobacteraceae bacterium]
MIRAVVALWLALLAVSATAIDTEQDLPTPALQQRYDRLINELRCLVCQNNTIADSNAGLASDLRREVRSLLLAGKSDAEILKFMTDRYGDFVLYRPPFVPRTWILWLAPALLLIVGVFIAFRIVRSRARLAASDTDDSDIEGEAR